MKEYRVVWKRESFERDGITSRSKQKRKRYVSLKRAERFMRLLTSAEPWKELGQDGDDYFCCSGHECGCGGQTVREAFTAKYADMPPVEFVRLEEREVGKWGARQI